MQVPPPGSLLQQIRGLPAGPALLERLADREGVYLVGGAVRDLLLGDRPVDLDLAVEGDVADVAGRLGGERVIHDRFGTSTVTAGGHTYDLARTRRERYARPGALPDVEPATLREDLERRDFTVNAMAIALGGPAQGALTAAPRAIEDLEDRQLRVLHPKSFLDDPTRLLRLVRYATRLGFATAEDTRRLAVRAIDEGAVRTVTSTRLGNELRLLAREPNPIAALEGLNGLRLDHALHPRFGLDDPEPARRGMVLLPPDGRADRLALAAAAQGMEADELAQWLDAMAFEASDREAIVAAASQATDLARSLEEARTPSQIARAASGAPVELVALAGAMGPAPVAQQWLQKLRTVRLEIDGTDLLAAGVRQGPEIGQALRGALDAKLDGHIHGRDEELALALSLAGGAG
jgi:tRNA nucleotidyltransferase (CCA-adding enzyme)